MPTGYWVSKVSFNDSENDYKSEWESEEQALINTVADMLDWIRQDWDLNETEQLAKAKEINKNISLGQYKEAIKVCNNYADGRQYDIWKDYLFGRSNLPSIDLLNFDEYEEEQDNSEPAVEQVEESFRPTHAGAICRGQCGQHNPYANADKDDYTYVCYQCKTLAQVFGGSIK